MALVRSPGIIFERLFCVAVPKAIPRYTPEIQQVRRREPLLFNYYREEQESSPNFTFLLRPRVIQEHQTVKLLCCVAGNPPPTVCNDLRSNSCVHILTMYHTRVYLSIHR